MSVKDRGLIVFFFNDTATTEIYTLSLRDALPICLVGGIPPHGREPRRGRRAHEDERGDRRAGHPAERAGADRSEEHTSELQSRQYLVCRLLLEKKKSGVQPADHCVLVH